MWIPFFRRSRHKDGDSGRSHDRVSRELVKLGHQIRAMSARLIEASAVASSALAWARHLDAARGASQDADLEAALRDARRMANDLLATARSLSEELERVERRREALALRARAALAIRDRAEALGGVAGTSPEDRLRDLERAVRELETDASALSEVVQTTQGQPESGRLPTDGSRSKRECS